MIFTDCVTDNSANKMYYKYAFMQSNFDALSYADKHRLVLFMAKILYPNLTVYFEDSLVDEVGRYDSTLDILYVNRAKFNSTEFGYPTELYAFVYSNIMKRYIEQRKLSKKSKQIEEKNSVIERKIEKAQTDDVELILMLLHNQEIENLRRLQEGLENRQGNTLCEVLNRKQEQIYREEKARIALERGIENDNGQSFKRGK